MHYTLVYTCHQKSYMTFVCWLIYKNSNQKPCYLFYRLAISVSLVLVQLRKYFVSCKLIKTFIIENKSFMVRIMKMSLSEITIPTMKECDDMKFYHIWLEWEKPPSTHNYKYLEIPILIIWIIVACEGKQTLVWNFKIL